MSKLKWLLAASLVTTFGATGSSIFRQRTRQRVPSPEGIEDPAIAAGFNRVARWPQMKLLRWYVARRAVIRQAQGEAVDLGCGPGYLAVELARHAPGLHVTGIDLSDQMLAEAERFAAQVGYEDQVSFRRGDVARIPFPDNSLDLVVSTLSLHHWSDPVAVLDEIARVLREPQPHAEQPSGAFLVFDLRRDMAPPFYLLLWFATRFVVPRTLRRANEPLASRNAAYSVQEAAELARSSQLQGWQVTSGPLWLAIEGRYRAPAASPPQG